MKFIIKGVFFIPKYLMQIQGLIFRRKLLSVNGFVITTEKKVQDKF